MWSDELNHSSGENWKCRYRNLCSSQEAIERGVWLDLTLGMRSEGCRRAAAGG